MYPKHSIDSYNSYQNPNDIFLNRKVNPKIHVESQGTLNTHNNLDKEEKTWYQYPDIRVYNKVIVIKTVLY